MPGSVLLSTSLQAEPVDVLLSERCQTTMETQTVAGTIETATEIRVARRGLVVFGGRLLPLSFVGYWMYATNSSTLPLRDLPLMVSPALAAAITRLVLREGLWDGSFRFSGRRSLGAIVLG
jgi:hypothetical protein